MSDHHDEHGQDSHSKGHGKGKCHCKGHGGGAHEEHEGAPEWLISFADNVALMMGFFVILLAMNMKEPTSGGIGGKEQHGVPPNDNLLDAVISIREAFNSPVDLDSQSPGDQQLIRRIIQRQTPGDTTKPGPEGHDHANQTARPADFVNVAGTVTFQESETVLSPSAREIVLQVAKQITGTRWIVEVRGHTSSAESFQSEALGRKLAYDRAFVVAQTLIEAGLQWNQIRVVSCGSADPIHGRAHSTTERLRNQRTDIILTQETTPDDPFNR